MVSYIDKKMREAAQGSDDFEQVFKLAVAANQTMAGFFGYTRRKNPVEAEIRSY